MKTISLTSGITIALIVIAIIACDATPAHKTPIGKKDAAPDVSAELVTRGHTLFLANCAACHGADGGGDDAPNLHHKNLPDAAITQDIAGGFPGEMPAFGAKLKAPDKQAIVAYVHSLQK